MGWLCSIVLAGLLVATVVGSLALVISLADPDQCCDLSEEDQEWLGVENRDDEYWT